MDHVTYFTHPFESIHDYRKVSLLMFSIKNVVNILQECGYL